MESFDQIIRHFGTPLSQLPLPKQPFKLNKYHVIGGLIVLGLASYGVYTIHKDYKERNNKSY